MAVPKRDVISPRLGQKYQTEEDLLEEIRKLAIIPGPVEDRDAGFNAGFPLPAPSATIVAGRPIQLTPSTRISQITPMNQNPPVITVEARRVMVEGLSQRDIDVIEGRPVYDLQGQLIDLTGLVPVGVAKAISEKGVQGGRKDRFYSRTDLHRILTAMNRRLQTGQAANKEQYAKAVQDIYNNYLLHQKAQQEAASFLQ